MQSNGYCVRLPGCFKQLFDGSPSINYGILFTRSQMTSKYCTLIKKSYIKSYPLKPYFYFILSHSQGQLILPTRLRFCSLKKSSISLHFFRDSSKLSSADFFWFLQWISFWLWWAMSFFNSFICFKDVTNLRSASSSFNSAFRTDSGFFAGLPFL